jgi:hypothetical protein
MAGPLFEAICPLRIAAARAGVYFEDSPQRSKSLSLFAAAATPQKKYKPTCVKMQIRHNL